MRPARSALLASLAAVLVLLAGCGGTSAVRAPASPPPAVAGSLSNAPPAGAVVDAQAWGTRDLAVARKASVATVTILDAAGKGVSGLPVQVDDRASVPCGAGCYRASAFGDAVVVRVGARRWQFTLPANAPSGRPMLAAAMRAYARLRSVSLTEAIASGKGDVVRTQFLFVAPDRLRYSIRGGSQAVVIGGSRWDRGTASARWVRSAQSPIDVMNLPWGNAVDPHVIAPGVVSFFDPLTQAWFRVRIDPATALPQTIWMTGTSHFMVSRYAKPNAPATIAPPKR